MRKYKFLCLTDHRSHSAENSIYALLSELHMHEQCQDIIVASRSLDRNQDFFSDPSSAELYGSQVGTTWRYTADGHLYRRDLASVDLSTIDVIWLRLPHPVSKVFLQSLPTVCPQAVIINKPSGILATSSKEYLLQHAQLCPPIAVCRTTDQIRQMVSQFPVVLKPLQGYGGHGIVKISDGSVISSDQTTSLDAFLATQKSYIHDHGYLAMKFLRRVSEGDKRLLYVDGTLLAGILRLPAEGQWLCNVAQGGKSTSTDITPEERHMIEKLTPDLRAQGIVLAGIDTLVDDDGQRKLSEINTMSIGGFPQAQAQTGLPILSQTIIKIIAYVNRTI